MNKFDWEGWAKIEKMKISSGRTDPTFKRLTKQNLHIYLSFILCLLCPNPSLFNSSQINTFWHLYSVKNEAKGTHIPFRSSFALLWGQPSFLTKVVT